MASETQTFSKATLADFQQIILEASRKKPVLVDFWADWCAPCKALDPILLQISAQLGDRLDIVKVNADEEASIAGQLGVRGLPTLMLFSDGRPVDQLVGAQPAEQILAMVARHMSSAADELIQQAIACRDKHNTAEAERLLLAALDEEPDNDAALRALIPLRAVAGDPEGAGELHSRLLRTDRESSWGVALATLIELAEVAAGANDTATLEKTLQEHSGDSETRAALAARYAVSGQHRQAMDEFLELVRRDKSFADQLGRRGLLAVFELEGEHSPLANEYRRKMAAALH